MTLSGYVGSTTATVIGTAAFRYWGEEVVTDWVEVEWTICSSLEEVALEGGLLEPVLRRLVSSTRSKASDLVLCSSFEHVDHHQISCGSRILDAKELPASPKDCPRSCSGHHRRCYSVSCRHCLSFEGLNFSLDSTAHPLRCLADNSLILFFEGSFFYLRPWSWAKFDLHSD